MGASKSDYFHRRLEAEPGEPRSSGVASRSDSGIRVRFAGLYAELRDIAERVLGQQQAQDGDAASDLLHDAFVKLRQEHERRQEQGLSAIGHKPEEVFKGCVGAACRDVLIDLLRRDAALKRGGDQQHVELLPDIEVPGTGPHQVLFVHEVLEHLENQDEELAQLVEARVFGMLSIEECAALFGVSSRTIARRWTIAVAWLRQRLR
ncbi:MAG: ECF-type sigma factor [Planctomycetota bacterium]|nr:ECF-type sigma factor [Planctomycetota bacterium]